MQMPIHFGEQSLFTRIWLLYFGMLADVFTENRTLLFLQLIMQMQNEMSGDRPATNILNQPQHILSFIKHALESSQPTVDESKSSSQTFGINSLRIVPETKNEGGDSDDEDDEDDETNPAGRRDEEMTATAINLLLSLLECRCLSQIT